jgi:hypothetical protein
MKISELEERFTIDPTRDIEPFFKLEKKIDIDSQTYRGCYNCGNVPNNMSLKSVAWTGVQFCWKCDSLNVIYYTDRMGGYNKDVVYIYKEKDA